MSGGEAGPFLPGAVLGVLGGGQLGRMFAIAARTMGYRVSVLAPGEDTPTGQIAYRETRAAYDDLEAVDRFAREVDVVTFEFENIPAAAVDVAARHAPVRPCGDLLLATQNRRREKATLAGHGLPVARHAVLTGQGDVASAATSVGFPAVVKTASWGYDGKGQRMVADADELATALTELGSGPWVMEEFVRFDAEISVVGARGVDGEVALYDPVLNHHSNHILDVTLCPAPVSAETRERAQDLTRRVLEAFDVVGVLCVEFFLLPDGGLVVNEVAPRPHNSGHVTIDSHVCSQFEQQVRAVCGLPLGTAERKVPAAAMANLLGDLWADGTPDWSALLAHPGVRLHLYGKGEARPGRKMGHLSVAAATIEEAEARVRAARAALTRTEET